MNALLATQIFNMLTTLQNIQDGDMGYQNYFVEPKILMVK